MLPLTSSLQSFPRQRAYRWLFWRAAACLVMGAITAFGSVARAGTVVLALVPHVQVDSRGVFLADLVTCGVSNAVPALRICDAPVFGQALTLSREQLSGIVRTNVAPDWTWADGVPDKIRIARRTRPLAESELKDRLVDVLQRDHVRERGQLELRLGRAWNTVMIPDDDFTVRILDLPALGVSPNFVVRFELLTARETVGLWHLPVQAKVWKDIWVARHALNRQQQLEADDLIKERRDVVGYREAVLDTPTWDPGMELVQNVQAGSPILMRTLRVRPVMRRGQTVEAQLKQGGVLISMKVEVLEEGAPGELIRVRNIQSRREFRGKIQNEQIIFVTL